MTDEIEYALLVAAMGRKEDTRYHPRHPKDWLLWVRWDVPPGRIIIAHSEGDLYEKQYLAPWRLHYGSERERATIAGDFSKILAHLSDPVFRKRQGIDPP